MLQPTCDGACSLVWPCPSHLNARDGFCCCCCFFWCCCCLFSAAHLVGLFLQIALKLHADHDQMLLGQNVWRSIACASGGKTASRELGWRHLGWHPIGDRFTAVCSMSLHIVVRILWNCSIMNEQWVTQCLYSVNTITYFYDNFDNISPFWRLCLFRYLIDHLQWILDREIIIVYRFISGNRMPLRM